MAEFGWIANVIFNSRKKIGEKSFRLQHSQIIIAFFSRAFIRDYRRNDYYAQAVEWTPIINSMRTFRLCVMDEIGTVIVTFFEIFNFNGREKNAHTPHVL